MSTTSLKLKIKANDEVYILSGKDKGKRRKVLSVIPKKERVIVEGINFIKRHTKKNLPKSTGGIITKEAPVHISNVKLICARCGKPTRTFRKLLENGRRVRMCVKCNEVAERS